jgi:hypothetical protein
MQRSPEYPFISRPVADVPDILTGPETHIPRSAAFHDQPPPIPTPNTFLSNDRPLSRGSDPASYPTEPLASFRTYRQLSGWNPPPLMIRAFGAHCQIQAHRAYVFGRVIKVIFDRADDVYVDVERKFAEALVRD